MTEIRPHPSRLRTAIIGTGGIAKAHLKAIESNKDIIELKAICDTDQERLQAFAERAPQAHGYRSFEEVLAHEDLDLVQLATPPSAHVALSIQAMRAGINVLCEKPLCGSLADCRKILETEEQTGKWCASVFQFRYGSGTIHLQNLQRENTLGRPLVAVCNTLWYRPRHYYDKEWRGRWSTELGGPTVGHGIHAMDHLLSILGDWEEVRADIGTLDRPIDVEDISMAIIRFANGAMASVVNSVLSPLQETYLRVDYQKATVTLKHLYGYKNEDWTFHPVEGAGEEISQCFKVLPENQSSDHAAQIKAIHQDILAGRKPQTTGVAAESTIDLISSLYKAALTGQPVTRRSILPGDPYYEAFHGQKSVSHRLILSNK